MKTLSGKTALVTGASSGIGRAIARRFHQEGAALLLMDIADRVVEGGTPTHIELGVPWFEGNVAVEKDVATAVQQAARISGRLDIVVNSAAVFDCPKLGDTTLQQWNDVMNVNLTGVFLVCREAIRQMLQQEIIDETRGRIVNLSSQHGMVASPNRAAYGVSKAGVAYLTRQLAVDYAKQGIICNAVAPGKILTGKGGQAVDPRVLEYSHARTPFPRLGKPDDVASAVLFLASAEATFITGENLMVDGGWMAG